MERKVSEPREIPVTNEKVSKLFNNYAPFGKKQFSWNDIRHGNVRSNMLIAIIRYANNKRHFIIFDLSCAIIPSSFHENKK